MIPFLINYEFHLDPLFYSELGLFTINGGLPCLTMEVFRDISVVELGLIEGRGLEGRSGALQYKLNKIYEISVMLVTERSDIETNTY